MASTREERMQQRLRGAQKREVADVDFGLTFPILGTGDVANPSKDELAAPNEQPTRRTPQHEQRAATPKGTARQGRRTPAVEEGGRFPVSNEGNTTASANISAKRKKLDVDTGATKDGTNTAGVGRDAVAEADRVVTSEKIKSAMAVRKVAGSRHGANEAEDAYALIDESDEVEVTVEQESPLERSENTAIPATRSTASPTLLRISSRLAKSSPAPTGASEEVAESPTDAPGSGHRTISSGGGGTSRSTRQLDSSLLAATPTPVPRGTSTSPTPSKKRKRGIGRVQVSSKVQRMRRSLSRQGEEDEDDIDELSPEQPRPQRRWTIVTKERESSKDGARSSQERDDGSDELKEAEAITDQAALQLTKNHRRRALMESPVLDEVAETAPANQTKKKARRPRKFSSPAHQRQPKPATPKSTTSKAAKKSKKPAGEPIPVTVHRLTRGPVYDEEESDADILNSEIPHAKRGGVNSIDVLSQICQEIIAAGLDSLEQTGAEIEDRKIRREYRTKWKAVEMFGTEMGTRLVEHTLNLDNVYSLEKRVREEHRKKLALRDEVLRIRAEREQVALRMDEVRIRHEKESAAVRERDSLNNTIHDIELAVERGREKSGFELPAEVEKSGIELVLKRIAGEVSSKGPGGGLLKRIKDFNAFLERAATALEGRKGQLV